MRYLMTALASILMFGHTDAEQINVQFLRYAGWSPDGEYLLVVDEGSGLRLFDRNQELTFHDESGFVLPSSESEALHIFSSDSRYFTYHQRIQSGETYEQRVMLVDLERELQVSELAINSLATFSAGGRYLAITDSVRQIALYELETGGVTQTFTIDETETLATSGDRTPSLYGIRFSADDRYLAAFGGLQPRTGLDNITQEMVYIQLGDTSTGENLWQQQIMGEGAVDQAWFVQGDEPAFVTVSGEALVAARDLGTQVAVMRFWDITSGETMHRLDVGRTLARSSEGHYVVSANHTGEAARVLSLDDRRTIATISDQSQSLWIDLSQDGNVALLVTAPLTDVPPEMLLWQEDSGMSRVPASHPAALSPDGHYLVTGGGAYTTDGSPFRWSRSDDVVRLWDTATGTLITDELTEIIEVDQMVFSPDSTHLLIIAEGVLQVVSIP
ncbi:MAG: hypothetical protein OHK0046_38780 [Anaerolineae bacterium]